MTPRAKLVLIAAGFAAPIAASYLAYHLTRPEPTANYGDLLLPPARITSQVFERIEGGPWRFGDLGGRWILVVSDSGECAAPCREKVATVRQVQLALGRNASRVARVYVVDDLHKPNPETTESLAGMVVALTSAQLPPGAANDRAHIYLVDPNGNVMMRWPAAPDRKRMLKDLERLLKASQIG